MERKKNHPLFDEISNLMLQGKISRRNFIRYAALLGMSATAAYKMAGLVEPKAAYAGTINRGGTLRVATLITTISNPLVPGIPAFCLVTAAGLQSLFTLDTKNIVHGLLAESWDISDDLKTWTINLRKGVYFNNGDEFTADDVLFSMSMWLDPSDKSPIFGALGELLDRTGIEIVNSHQIKLHLKTASITIPLIIGNPRALVLNHRTFEGDYIKAPHGTGPYTLVEFEDGELCTVKRRDNYWEKGADGNHLPYLDGVKFVDVGGDSAPLISALQNDKVDLVAPHAGNPIDVYEVLKNNSDMKSLRVSTGTANVIRMHCEKKPFDDNRARMALKLCQNREKMLGLAAFGLGVLGHDVHVYPNHPEYCEKPIPKYDPVKAKALLAEAGYPNGVDVKLVINGTRAEQVRLAEILREDSAPAGFRLEIESKTEMQYWENWTKYTLGISRWSHRPYGVIICEMGYSLDDEGKASQWNETHWVDKEFEELLVKAHQTPDHDERRKLFCRMEDIQMERGSIGVPYFNDIVLAVRKRVMNFVLHPEQWLYTREIWLDEKT